MVKAPNPGMISASTLFNKRKVVYLKLNSNTNCRVMFYSVSWDLGPCPIAWKSNIPHPHPYHHLSSRVKWHCALILNMVRYSQNKPVYPIIRAELNSTQALWQELSLYSVLKRRGLANRRVILYWLCCGNYIEGSHSQPLSSKFESLSCSVDTTVVSLL